MGLWDDLTVDAAELTDTDGEQVKITTAGGVYYVKAMWQALSLEGGDQGGPRMWVAAADLPSDFTQGNTVTYDGSTYTVSHRAPDGHGVEAITLKSE